MRGVTCNIHITHFVRPLLHTHSMFYKRHPIRDIVLILERFRDRLYLVGGELIIDIFYKFT